MGALFRVGRFSFLTFWKGQAVRVSQGGPAALVSSNAVPCLRMGV